MRIPLAFLTASLMACSAGSVTDSGTVDSGTVDSGSVDSGFADAGSFGTCVGGLLADPGRLWNVSIPADGGSCTRSFSSLQCTGTATVDGGTLLLPDGTSFSWLGSTELVLPAQVQVEWQESFMSYLGTEMSRRMRVSAGTTTYFSGARSASEVTPDVEGILGVSPGPRTQRCADAFVRDSDCCAAYELAGFNNQLAGTQVTSGAWTRLDTPTGSWDVVWSDNERRRVSQSTCADCLPVDSFSGYAFVRVR